MEFIENLVNSSTFYYCLIGIAYVLCIVFVVMLLVNRKKKRYIENTKPEVKKDLESVDLEAVLEKMQEEVSKSKDEIMTFEEEQEEKAIISYQELLNAVKKNVNEVTRTSEVNPLEEKDVFEPVILQTENKIKEEPKTNKFQNSEFISPIYGRVNNDVDYPKIKSFEEVKKEEDLEKTIIMPKLNSSVDSNDEFLRILKEFRNNLE